MSELICVTFWEDEDHLLTWNASHYPSYNEGDSIWLEITSTPKGDDEYDKPERMSLAEYKIKEVRHSVKKEFSHDITVRGSLEVHVEKANKGDRDE